MDIIFDENQYKFLLKIIERLEQRIDQQDVRLAEFHALVNNLKRRLDNDITIDYAKIFAPHLKDDVDSLRDRFNKLEQNILKDK